MLMVDVLAAVGDRTSHNNFDCSTVRKYFLRKRHQQHSNKSQGFWN